MTTKVPSSNPIHGEVYSIQNLLDPGRVKDDDKNLLFGIVLYCWSVIFVCLLSRFSNYLITTDLKILTVLFLSVMTMCLTLDRQIIFSITVSSLLLKISLVEINGNMPKLTIIRKSGQKADKNN
jgi:hypothetical protein